MKGLLFRMLNATKLGVDLEQKSARYLFLPGEMSFRYLHKE